jgi:hypothetical protein
MGVQLVFRKLDGQSLLQNNTFQTVYKINANDKMNADNLFWWVKEEKTEWAFPVRQNYSPYS